MWDKRPPKLYEKGLVDLRETFLITAPPLRFVESYLVVSLTQELRDVYQRAQWFFSWRLRQISFVVVGRGHRRSSSCEVQILQEPTFFRGCSGEPRNISGVCGSSRNRRVPCKRPGHLVYFCPVKENKRRTDPSGPEVSFLIKFERNL